MCALFSTSFPVTAVQKLLKLLRIDRVAVKCTLSHFAGYSQSVVFSYFYPSSVHTFNVM